MTLFDRFRKYQAAAALPALCALASIAIVPTVPASATAMTLELCTADGQIQTVTISLNTEGRKKDRRECASPCHAVLSRKSSKPGGADV